MIAPTDRSLEHQGGTDALAYRNRRELLAGGLALGGVAYAHSANAAAAARVAGPSLPPGLDQNIGFALFTVQRIYEQDPARVFSALREMGVREVQPRTYARQTPTQFRALLDRAGLTCHSTHEFSMPGPGLEKDLEGLQVMGIKYARFPIPGVPLPGSQAPGAPPREPQAETPELMRRVAEDLNRNGKIAQKFGIKALYHNHTTEFQRHPGEPLLPYEVLLKETDPDLVAMELDIGWAAVAGQDIVKMFQDNPGRYELWHIKDAINLRYLRPDQDQLQRRAGIYLVPVGLGEVDYATIFRHAEMAGMRHFYIEQDNAAAWGDAMAATVVSVRNLKAMLSK